MRSGRAAPHTLAGAYALDALDGRDRTRFRRHLARCQECAGEVDDLREAAARLAAAVSTAPSAAMKHRVLAVAARTRQLPPATDRPPAGRPVRAVRLGLPGLAGRHRVRLRDRAWPGDRAWLPRLVTALAAVVLLAGGAAWLARPTATSFQRPGDGHVVAAVLNAPDAAMIHARITTGGTATVVMSHREGMLVFTAAGLRSLPGTECYELWLVGRGSDRPAPLAWPGGGLLPGVLPMPRHGMTGPVAASGLRPGDRLGLSVEPVTGSARPTSAMIMVVSL
jgi:hypothetical protein